ncbi:MAG TPA: DUF1016 N-terminal domain-containing protein [Candidatus Omnitrophota bacterium]|nr:DUF1016 N-terminal domain-containing protein [Candidatus Omnitrophota bacterium]HQL41686.1 DUF1016 N-terminal domain-containing protein [Candidatus Omnitrophota bacterium]
MTKILSNHFYREILTKIQQQILEGKRNIEESYRLQVLQTHWNIGKILEEPFAGDFENSSERARMIERLSKDLERPTSFFYDLSKFYRFYPSLPTTPLTWSHYSDLIRVDDARQRQRFEQQAIREGLSSQKLYQLIFMDKITQEKKKEAGQLTALAKPGELACVRGKLYRYRCLFRKDISCQPRQALVDMGFGILRKVDIPDWQTNRSPVPVTSYKDKEGYSIRRATKHPEYLYTYKATIVKIVDADTLVLYVDLGFDSWIEQKLRLRGIDAPEVSTVLGMAAKEYVQEIFNKVDCVVCKTYREDKYGRYLADIFYSLTEKDPEIVAQQGTYLNQELLERGYAKLYEEE